MSTLGSAILLSCKSTMTKMENSWTWDLHYAGHNNLLHDSNNTIEIYRSLCQGWGLIDQEGCERLQVRQTTLNERLPQPPYLCEYFSIRSWPSWAFFSKISDFWSVKTPNTLAKLQTPMICLCLLKCKTRQNDTKWVYRLSAKPWIEAYAVFEISRAVRWPGTRIVSASWTPASNEMDVPLIQGSMLSLAEKSSCAHSLMIFNLS